MPQFTGSCCLKPGVHESVAGSVGWGMCASVFLMMERWVCFVWHGVVLWSNESMYV